MIESKGLIAGSVAPDKEYLKLLVDLKFKFISYRADSPIIYDGFNHLKVFDNYKSRKER